jgi:TPR repeat protein
VSELSLAPHCSVSVAWSRDEEVGEEFQLQNLTAVELVVQGSKHYHSDRGLAQRFFLEAAGMGDLMAARYLGSMYYHQQQYVSSVKWFKSAAARGDGASQRCLGQLYLHGLGDPPSACMDHSMSDSGWFARCGAEQSQSCAAFLSSVFRG